MPLNKKGKKIMEKMKKEYGKKKGESVFYAMENSGKLKGVKKAKQGMMTNLKPVPAGKEKSLGKLPPEVRNRMGYAKYGKMMKAKMGAQVSDKEIETIKKLANAQVSDKEAKNQRENLRIETIKKLAGAQVSDKEAKKIISMMPKKSHGGSMKKGYGKARSSGMGLEDESLVPGKGYEYIKDLL
jgi:hypothetical protein